MTAVRIGDRLVGEGHPCYIICEIGINHQASLAILRQLIDVAHESGCDAVKLQTRTPELQVPPEKWDVLRDTPWGEMRTIDYRRKIELSDEQLDKAADQCTDYDIGLDLFSSPWDVPSVERLEDLINPPAYKIASAVLPNKALLTEVRNTGKPVIMSSGMSTMDDLRRAVDHIGDDDLVILHCVSDYPAQDGVLNLRVIQTLREEFTGVPIGYSGHEVGILPSLIAVARYGACMVERHVTMDRGMKGSDHGASLEPNGIRRLVRDIRRAEALLACDGIKRVTPGEAKQIERLRLTA